jgi:hypothetical protein
MTLIVAVIGPATVLAKAPPGLDRFADAVGQVESGGRYTARNRNSGAYGKYQILPSNWPSWARIYLGNSRARHTPANQEKVARGKFTTLYRSLDSWRRVAYWWLTGSSRRSGWSTYATRYVNKVLRYYRHGIGGKRSSSSARRYGERSWLVSYQGTWRTAHHDRYTGDTVAYSTTAGASATFRFTGRSVTWFGPVGPTRGKARVYVDGGYVRTVDLRRGGFSAHDAVFRRSWKTAGSHTLMIEVVGGSQPMVASTRSLSPASGRTRPRSCGGAPAE